MQGLLLWPSRYRAIVGYSLEGKSQLRLFTMSHSLWVNGDLNNTSAARAVENIQPDPTYSKRSLAIAESDDDSEVRQKYRPFLLDRNVQETDWVSQLELGTALKLSETDFEETGARLKILVLYGSLRGR